MYLTCDILEDYIRKLEWILFDCILYIDISAIRDHLREVRYPDIFKVDYFWDDELILKVRPMKPPSIGWRFILVKIREQKYTLEQKQN